MPTDVELKEYYQKYDVLGEREPYYQKLWDADALNTAEGKDVHERFCWAKSFCKNFGKTIDVGSGPGLFLSLVKGDGGDPIGTELNAAAAEKSSRLLGVPVISGTIANVDVKNFDTITLWDLLEHVNDPKQLIKDCATRLKNDGLLFIETPNEGSLLDVVVLFLVKIGICGPASTFYGLHHLVLFRHATIRRLLAEGGFKVIKICGARTTIDRVFRGKGIKDKMMRFGLGGLFFVAKLVGKQNKMLIVARKLKKF